MKWFLKSKSAFDNTSFKGQSLMQYVIFTNNVVVNAKSPVSSKRTIVFQFLAVLYNFTIKRHSPRRMKM